MPGDSSIVSYDFKEYVPPYTNRYYLTLYSRFNATIGTNEYVEEYDNLSFSKNSRGYFNIRGVNRRNSRKFQINRGVNFYFRSTINQIYNLQEHEKREDKAAYYGFSLNLKDSSLWYYKSKSFVELKVKSLTGYQLDQFPKTKDLEETSTVYLDSIQYKFSKFTGYNQNLTFDNILELHLGQGRIKNVTWPIIAKVFFDYLKRTHQSIRSVTGRDIQAFAELMERLYNKRFFDSRLKRIQDVEILTDFLLSIKIVSKAPPRLALELYDFYEYGPVQKRTKGQRIGYGIGSKYKFQFLKSKKSNQLSSLKAPKGYYTQFPLDTLIQIAGKKSFKERWNYEHLPRYYFSVYHIFENPMGYSNQIKFKNGFNLGFESHKEYGYLGNGVFNEFNLSAERKTWYGSLSLDQTFNWFLSRRTTIGLGNSALLVKTIHKNIVKSEKIHYSLTSNPILNKVSDSFSTQVLYYFSSRFWVSATTKMSLNYFFDSELMYLNSDSQAEIKFIYRVL